MEWKTVQGTQDSRPLEIDTESSSRVIYLRRNIKKMTRVDDDGRELNYWQYEELEIEKGNDAKLYVLVGELMQSISTQDAIMMALADIYSKLVEMEAK